METTALWTPEERGRLNSLQLDFRRNNKETLIKLVKHFQAGGGVWAVSEGGTGPVTVSRGLARKVRDLTAGGKLDWLVTTRGRVGDNHNNGKADNSKTTAGIANADEEVKSHWRGLFYFGQAFRDRLEVLEPHVAVKLTPSENQVGMWDGYTSRLSVESPRDAEEQRMEADWCPGCYYDERFYDARTHPLFPWFRHHLAEHSCWETLEDLIREFRGYVKACQDALAATQEIVASEIPDLSPRDVTLEGEWAFQEAIETAGGTGRHPIGIHLAYELKLRLLRAQLAETRRFRELAKIWKNLEVLSSSFKSALKPDDLLRKLIRAGHCHLCP